MVKRVLILVLAAALAACGRSHAPDGSGTTGAVGVIRDAAGAQCVLADPAQLVGSTPELTIAGTTLTRSHQPDAPGPLEMPVAGVGTASGDCARADRYRFGSGLYDTTGPIGGDPAGHADMIGYVVPPQIIRGIHTRLYARAFAIESPCNGKRIAFVSDDHAFPSGLLRQEVLKAIAADPQLKDRYDGDNVMLSATHTHSANGGFGEPTFLPSLPPGTPSEIVDAFAYPQNAFISTTYYDDDNFRVMVGGIVQAIKRADANLQAHPQAAPIRMSIGELLNAARNRDPLAYRQNAPSERARYVDGGGNEITIDRRFLQLDFVRDSGSAVGVLNWFGVHPTAMSNHNLLISGDTKGFASLGFERLMGTRYVPDADGVPAGDDNFVAAFAQTDEGNSIPDLFVFDAGPDGSDAPGEGVPYPNRLGTDDPYAFDQPGYERGMRKANAIFGTKQLIQAIKQYGKGSVLRGPVDHRLFYVDMNDVDVTDPYVLERLAFDDLPQDLYADDIRTCTSGSGIAFLGGGANGLGPGAAGYTCVDTAPEPYFDDARNHYNGGFNGSGTMVAYKNGVPVEIPFDGPTVSQVLTPLLCARTALDPQYACQKEKPVLAEFSSEPAPFQIFRVGNLAILGVPWEVTAMAGRRLREAVLDVLTPVGVDTVVIAGLSNAYLDYMTTREEYSAQMYEGASNSYGPWQLAAAQQEARRLAQALASGEPAPDGVGPATLTVGDPSPIITDLPAEFGSTLVDAQEAYAPGDTVDVTFVAGYPGNDLKLMSSYAFAERRTAQGTWETVATDRDPELLFIWNFSENFVETALRVSDESSAQIVWTIPRNLPPGTYRIRHDGVSRASASEPPQPYLGISREFAIAGDVAACP